MSAPAFGFSVGDFIAMINILVQGYKALQATGGAASKYQEHVRFLELLTSTVARLGNSSCLHVVEDEIKHCKRPIQDFRQKIEKYKKDLEPGAILSVHDKKYLISIARTAKSKIKWALTAEKDVITLRTAIGQHLDVISLKIASYSQYRSYL